jgi:hypothetical protein
MAVTKEVSKIIWLLTGLSYHSDGSATVVLTKGYTEEFIFKTLSSVTFQVPKADVDMLLDVPPSGLTRRKDVGDMTYAYALSHGYITGIIS